MKDSKYSFNFRKVNQETEILIRKMLRVEEEERINWDDLFKIKDKYFNSL